jgi:hypothetical protein
MARLFVPVCRFIESHAIVAVPNTDHEAGWFPVHDSKPGFGT